MRRTGQLIMVVVFCSCPTVGAQETPAGAEVKQAAKKETAKPVEGKPAKANTTAKKGKPQDDGWKVLFDGKSLAGWERAKGFDFEEKSKVDVKDGCLILGTGSSATGVRWKGDFPKSNYEVRLEGKRVEGNDFFCGMSFPVGDGSLTLILGGWGGWVTGLSCIDGFYAIDTETCSSFEFKNGVWYKIRLRVTDDKIEAWVNDEQIVEFEKSGQKLTVSMEMEPCLPFGFATWETTGALRKIALRKMPPLKSAGSVKRP